MPATISRKARRNTESVRMGGSDVTNVIHAPRSEAVTTFVGVSKDDLISDGFSPLRKKTQKLRDCPVVSPSSETGARQTPSWRTGGEQTSLTSKPVACANLKILRGRASVPSIHDLNDLMRPISSTERGGQHPQSADPSRGLPRFPELGEH